MKMKNDKEFIRNYIKYHKKINGILGDDKIIFLTEDLEIFLWYFIINLKMFQDNKN